MKKQARYYQTLAVNETMDWLAKRDDHPLIVLPTGTGKSLVIAEICKIAMAYPGTRVMNVTHVRELVAQNYGELISEWGDAPAGIYSASLKRKELRKPITFASIQSIYRKYGDLPPQDLILIDEAHLVPRDTETMYGAFLQAMKIKNPSMRVIGLTATAMRMDSGMLFEGEGAIFGGISYEYSIKQAIEDGYLAPLISKDPQLHLDTSGVGTRGGEFIPGQLQTAVDLDPVNQAAVAETIQWGRDRRSWLFFCSGISHAQHIAAAVREAGYSCEAISSETPAEERDRIIKAFKRGEIRALASMNILTTGFNAPAVDLIAMLRPTKSASLYIQMAGRGTRCVGANIQESIQNGKANCLVLDFAENVSRFGPIDMVNVREPGEGGGEAPFKVCPTCRSILAAAARVCGDCGHQFPPPAPKIMPVASTENIVSGTETGLWKEIDSVSYSRHEGKTGTATLKATYFEKDAFDNSYSEWLCFDHERGSFPQRKAANWWAARGGEIPVPASVDEALRRKRELNWPSECLVRKNGKYWEILALRSQGTVRNVLERS